MAADRPHLRRDGIQISPQRRRTCCSSCAWSFRSRGPGSSSRSPERSRPRIRSRSSPRRLAWRPASRGSRRSSSRWSRSRFSTPRSTTSSGLRFVEGAERRGAFHRRWIAAFAFGLVYGFAFSFALGQTLQFAGSHLVTAVLTFNAGIELAQLLVLVLAVPALWCCSASWSTNGWAPSSSRRSRHMSDGTGSRHVPVSCGNISSRCRNSRRRFLRTFCGG